MSAAKTKKGDTTETSMRRTEGDEEGSSEARLQLVRNDKGKRATPPTTNENYQGGRVKRLKKQTQGQESDDDFEIQPCQGGGENEVVKKMGKQNIKESIKDVKSKYLTIRTRSSPNLLVKAMGRMTGAQKQAVKNIGFGSLFEMQVSEIPGRM
ncbi:unnamed protein product, partial [Cuscuta europaea]